MTTKVAIVDSGVNYSHPKIKEIKIFHKYNVLEKNSDVDDFIGHGTAVTGIISGIDTDIEFSIFKIYEHDLSCDLGTLLAALRYIWDNVECNILHLSLGIGCYDQRLYDICKAFNDRGTLIVAAFNNDGSISYPAAFDCVIGVEAKRQCGKRTDFFVPDGDDIVNVYAKGGFHRVAWTQPEYVIQQGNSMSAAYVTGYLSKHYNRGLGLKSAVQLLKDISTFVPVEFSLKATLQEIEYSKNRIKRAALFPYSKEMSSLINYAELLDFQIVDIYTCSYMGNLKKRVNGIYDEKIYEIKNINDIDYQSIDTLILGHLTELSELTHIEYKNDLLSACLERGINVFSFDSCGLSDFTSMFKKANLMLFSPDCYKKEMKKRNGKLYQVFTPVLGVLGTSSKQGKFTLQLQLRKNLIRRGYKIGQLATEPNAPLFGIDECIPFGYNSNMDWKEYEFINYVNGIMGKLDKKSFDIIIVGSQSGTIPESYCHIGQMPVRQLEFLLGTLPDGVILCVNPNDDLEYIRRTISIINNLVNAEVIALAIYPFYFKSGWDVAVEKKDPLTMEQIEYLKYRYKENLDLVSYVIGDLEDGEALTDAIISFYSEEEVGNGEI